MVDIAICSRNAELSDALKSTIEEKVTRLARFLDGFERAEVNFSEERNPRISAKEVCEVTMHGHGRTVRAHAAAADALGAVDRVIDKLEHRMEKLKGKRLVRSHVRRHGSVDFAADGGETTQPADEMEDLEVDAGPAGLGRNRIVKIKKFAMKPMTPEEAVLQMDLLGHQFFFFANAETGSTGVVYRRTDGFVGLIDAT
jgi:putative sigma-54 modulation protein